jgi:ABC-type cobalamin/Fe3+-siderophores transport system ATPase subunit
VQPFDVELRLRNYRCFGEEPVHLRLTDGFTALVGLNNGGKSTLLRALYEMRPLFNVGYAPDTLRGQRADRWFGPSLVSAGERVWRNDAERDVELSVIIHARPDGRNDDARVEYQFTYHRSGATSGQVLLEGQPLDGPSAAQQTPAFESILPVLADTLYVGPFRSSLSPGGGTYYDLTMGQPFVSQFRAFKTGGNPEQNEAVIALQEEIAQIFGFERLDINASDDGATLQLFIDGRSFRLSELGAGLSHFVVVLLNILVRRPSFLLIDEPELNLHASLQLDFLTTLAKYAKVGVLFATHSMGLARTAADRILVVNREAAGRQVEPYEGSTTYGAMAAQLAFDGTPSVGYEKVCLVEGRSEVRAVMQLLRLYDAEHRIALVPMGGGELLAADIEVELRELQRLGPVTFLIDSERTSPGSAASSRHEAFMAAAEKVGIAGHMLHRRAFENYLTDDAVRRAFGAGVSALGPFDVHGGGAGWKKTQNWRAAAHMSRADLDQTDLGQFLAHL